MNKPVKPTLAGYYTGSAVAAGCLALLDHSLVPLLRAACRPTRLAAPPYARILLSSLGGLGDVVVATSLIPVLKAAYPGLEIGFLVGPPARAVVQRHPDVRWVHVYDHCLRKSRSLRGLWKIRENITRLVMELNTCRYDMAIELGSRAQNAIPALFLAGIPVRVGYSSGGFGALLTHRADWKPTGRHITEYHKNLLRLAGTAEECLRLCHETLPVRKDRVLAGLAERNGGEQKRVICHPGAGFAGREWPAEFWAQVTHSLEKQGHLVIFTGAGSGDEQSVRRILAAGGCGTSLCNRLDWDGFVAGLFESHLVITVDTVAQHVAGAFDRDCVVIGSGLHPQIWFPRHPNHRYLRHDTPCTPCYRADMCVRRECILMVKPSDVISAASEFLEKTQWRGKDTVLGAPVA